MGININDFVFKIIVEESLSLKGRAINISKNKSGLDISLTSFFNFKDKQCG